MNKYVVCNIIPMSENKGITLQWNIFKRLKNHELENE